MSTTHDACTRCGTPVPDDDPHVWLEIQSADLGYEPIDQTHLLCEDCYDEYREFLQS